MEPFPHFGDQKNKTLTKSASGMFENRPQSMGGHVQRLRQLKANRNDESLYQTNLIYNIENF